AADGAEGEHGEAEYEWPTTAEPVRQRALGDLSHSQAGEPGGQGELGGAGGGAEGCLHRREGREVHIGGTRPDGDEQAQQAGKPGGNRGWSGDGFGVFDGHLAAWTKEDERRTLRLPPLVGAGVVIRAFWWGGAWNAGSG